jgi:hypothetical protein
MQRRAFRTVRRRRNTFCWAATAAATGALSISAMAPAQISVGFTYAFPDDPYLVAAVRGDDRGNAFDVSYAPKALDVVSQEPIRLPDDYDYGCELSRTYEALCRLNYHVAYEIEGHGGADKIRLHGGREGTESHVDGGEGPDTLIGGRAGDYLRGGAGSDSLAGGRGDDLLQGGGGATSDDVMRGGPGNDDLLSGGGADLFSGGPGDDYIYTRVRAGAALLIDGGPGRDTCKIQRTDPPPINCEIVRVRGR